jgi:hypothetical protein
VAGIHPFRLEQPQQFIAACVTTDFSNERHARPEPRGGHRLVRPLASRSVEEEFSRSGLARFGQRRPAGDEIGVDASDHNDIPGVLLHDITGIATIRSVRQLSKQATRRRQPA